MPIGEGYLPSWRYRGWDAMPKTCQSRNEIIIQHFLEPILKITRPLKSRIYSLPALRYALPLQNWYLFCIFDDTIIVNLAVLEIEGE
jgi:hypothetical protein